MSPQTAESKIERSRRDHLWTQAELEQFEKDGYLIQRDLGDERLRHEMLQATFDGLRQEIEPIEYEADLHYPGSPESRLATGGHTVRRLKQAHSRHFAFTEWISRPEMTGRLHQLLGPDVVMPLAHHNCVMTKQSRYSSDTGWHQDIRYWSYERPELVSVWLALGSEHPENGCLQLIPGSHRMKFDGGRLDEHLFLRGELPQNQELIESAVYAELEPGDVLFFHCGVFHAASRNRTDAPKISAVFTFRPGDNPPVAGTRSASLSEILIPQYET